LGSVIDTTVFVDAERGKLDLQTELGRRLGEWIGISAVTASELLHGVHKAPTPSVRDRRSAFVEMILGSMPVIPFDLAVARLHAQLDAELEARGEKIGAHDLMIGATALLSGHSVVTRDMRSFPRIPGLKVEKW
jgi:predicted nucleic acid-binding protein